MRYSRYYIPTVKETPADAEVVSHQLMIRAGMIRQLSRGIYDYLPLGLRVIRKVETIIRQEMERAGSAEVLLPMVQPAELWKQTARWDAYIKEGLLATLKDRHSREYCLGPTHEEVITDLVRRDVRSYKELPVSLFQIQTKFRDEIRPRFGLMRGREFLMKDAYTFDRDSDGALKSYWGMFEAYSRVFARCGLEFRPVEALTGNIGGSLSHEFQVIAETGEDAIAACDKCNYAANLEKATARSKSKPQERAEGVAEELAGDGDGKPEKVHTPGKHTVEEVAEFLKVKKKKVIKTLIYETNHGPIAALVRGDHEVNEFKLQGVVDAEWIRLATEETVQKVTGGPVGFSGPVGLDIPIYIDHSLSGMTDAIVGANEKDQHLENVQPARDFQIQSTEDLRNVVKGDACPRCDRGKLQIKRGIEVGHVFYLGTKYSTALEATVLDEDGKPQPMEMGCYGIGVTRTVAAAMEQNHDKDGVKWPTPIAPFTATVISANPDDEAVVGAAEKLYAGLQDAGLDVLYDDRNARAGFKFKDADLIGAPYRVIVGARGIKDGLAELKDRRTGDVEKVELDEVVALVRDRVAADLTAANQAADEASAR